MPQRRRSSNWDGGGHTAQTLGSRMMFRGPSANIGKEAQKVMKGCLLLKRWGLMVNTLEMMMWPGGTLQGPGEGMTLIMGQRSMHNGGYRIDRMPELHQLRKPVDTEHQHEHVEHRNNVDWMSHEPSQE